MKINKKIFLDINVVIDFLERSRPRHAQTVELFRYLTENGYEICISEDMLTTIFYISRNKTSVLKFLKVVLDKWQVLHFGEDVIKEAINITLENNLDLEDVLQCLCAKEHGCAVLITNDGEFFDCGMSIYSAESFLKNKPLAIEEK